MEARHRISVAILFRHPLFGEGIAHFLSAEPSVAAQFIAIGRGEPAAEALASHARPDIVIVERTDGETAVELLRMFPDVLVIEVALEPGPTFAWRREEIGSRPEEIARTIREFAGRAAGGAADEALSRTEASPPRLAVAHRA